METWRPALDAAVSAIAEPGPLPGLPADATSRVWDEIIRTRALVLDEMAARHRFALDIEDPGTDALVQGLHEARRRLSALMSERPDPVNPDLFSERLRQGREDEERSERALAERISGARDEELQRGVTFEQVAAALPRNAALIAYVRFTRVIPPQTAAVQGQRPPDPRPGVPSYFALVLRAGASPVALLLGATAEIDARVTRWREEASSMPMDGSATRRYRAAGAKLREAIWDPLVSRLAGAGEVLIVPEGMINLVNFATLPVARDGYLIEQRRLLHYLSAERDLVRLSTRHPQAASAKGLLLFGGPEFDPGPVDRNPADRGRPDGRAIYRGPTPACASFRDLTFEPLPGAVAEVDRIRALWNASPAARSGGGSEAEVFVGPGADESTFKSVAAGHRIVHLATHAFFTGEGCDGTDAAAPMRAAEKPDPRPALLEENPLLLSGLAFAGANGRNDRAAAGRLDDGVLTAQEIASLDLRGVEWVVLSACGTGIGPIETGEGVMGLRRTFQIAGARSVVMSLWSVDDHSAREWTHRLYGSRLSGRSTAASLRDASLRLLEARRRAGVTTHPFSWGAFVAVGDWK
jgi:CHAT domain-containing protein